jgi:hypothetical protein
MTLSVHDKCCSCRFSFNSVRITPHREDLEEKTRTGTKNTARRLRLTLFADYLSVRTWERKARAKPAAVVSVERDEGQTRLPVKRRKSPICG